MFGINTNKEGQKLNPKQVITKDIGALTEGQSLRYKLGAKYGSGKDTAVIEINPDHGKKMGEAGRKYMVTIEEEKNKYSLGYNNSADQLAEFIMGRKGVKAV